MEKYSVVAFYVSVLFVICSSERLRKLFMQIIIIISFSLHYLIIRSSKQKDIKYPDLLASSFKICKRGDPNINQCMKTAIADALPLLKNGKSRLINYAKRHLICYSFYYKRNTCTEGITYRAIKCTECNYWRR